MEQLKLMFDNRNSGYQSGLSGKISALISSSMRLPISSPASAARTPALTQTHILHKSPNPSLTEIHQSGPSRGQISDGQHHSGGGEISWSYL